MLQKDCSYIFYLTLVLTIVACRKTSINPTGTASLTIINAIPASGGLVTNFSGNYTLPNYYNNATRIMYNDFQVSYQLSAYSGTQRLMLYNYPDTLPKSKPVADITLNLPLASINSLFITGTLSQADTVFTTDQLPYHPTSDSTMGIRFINLSPGANAVSINLAGQANGSETDNLPYKGITGFKKYTATSTVSSYTFEFRDKANGALLCSYVADGVNNNSSNPDDPVNRWRFRNCTLALLNLPDNGSGSTAQTVLLINNY